MFHLVQTNQTLPVNENTNKASDFSLLYSLTNPFNKIVRLHR